MRREPPQVFISSTFYDLQQVRADLAAFVEEQLGYTLLASEHRSFPVDPRADTIENCRKRVTENADIFVLIIGTRSGSVVSGTNRSVTNLEYLAARSKGIPIFAFIHRDVLTYLALFERNPDADFSGLVDSPRLFEFVKQVRETDRVWMHAFEFAQDIIGVIRTQLAHETAQGLDLILRSRDLPSIATSLTGAAFRTAVEQPDAWEAKLFAEVVSNEVTLSADARRAHDVGLATGFGETITEDRISAWIITAMEDAQGMILSMEQIGSNIINPAFQSENVEAIVHGGREVGRLYRHALEWASRLRRAHVPSEHKILVTEIAKMLDHFLNETSQFGTRIKTEIEEALARGGQGVQRLNINFNFHVSASDLLNSELQRLQRRSH